MPLMKQYIYVNAFPNFRNIFYSRWPGWHSVLIAFCFMVGIDSKGVFRSDNFSLKRGKCLTGYTDLAHFFVIVTLDVIDKVDTYPQTQIFQTTCQRN